MVKSDVKVALVHDWFLSNSISGAEKVTIALDKYISKNFSEPELYSLTENISNSKNKLFDGRQIKTSFLQKLPYGKNSVQKYLSLIPFAIEQLNLSKFDLIISSSHIAAKGVLTSPDQLHISYIHTPMRYAWDQMNTYIENSTYKKIGLEIPLRYLLFKLREWDFVSGNRPDILIANSTFTSRRIKKYWGKDSEVIFPPVEIERFKFNHARSNFYLTVNRLVPNKRIDLLIEAFNKLNLPLIIVGEGPEKNNLKKIAGKNITFNGKTTNKCIENLMSQCRAFVYPGVEDFGIAPVEAIAAGAPVIGLARGGLLDSVNCLNNCTKNEIATGILFQNQTSSDIVDTINWFEEKKIWKLFSPEDMHNYSTKFSKENFNHKVNNSIQRSWESFEKRYYR
tara:strand:+ start:941 stop:2125 length:1185 start_codon:yes stop_codon:yes gene_type:complete